MLDIDFKSDNPIYQQVVEQVRAAVFKGALSPGDRLPAVRKLATKLTINPNTIQKAYQELERQGVIVTVRGRGTFVAEDYTRTADSGELEALRAHFRKGIIDAHYMGLSPGEIEELVQELLQEHGHTGRDESC